jgi:hypothetical protein
MIVQYINLMYTGIIVYTVRMVLDERKEEEIR